MGRLEFDADNEQQEDYAELGDITDFLDLVDETEPPGADNGAGKQKRRRPPPPAGSVCLRGNWFPSYHTRIRPSYDRVGGQRDIQKRQIPVRLFNVLFPVFVRQCFQESCDITYLLI